MREVKFRAWDKTRKEYLSGGKVLISIEQGKRPKRNIIYLDILKDPDMYRKRFIIEQCTGLKDISGNETYEGDILKYYSGSENLFMIVRFGEYKEDCGSNLGFYVEHIKKEQEYYRKDLLFWLEESEVIGNINENPELLEAVNE